MSKLGSHRSAFKVQRALNIELPGLGKSGALERRPYPPGQHGMARRKYSEYGLRLREKQKILFHYGLREEQLRRLVKKAKTGRSPNWMTALIGILETRLDNVVFRLGFAPSIAAARQLVRHGKVRVNGKKIDIGSCQVKKTSEISLSDSGYAGNVYQYSIKQPRLLLPDWLEHSSQGENKVGRLRDIPGEDAVPFPYDGQLIVEFYSGI